MESQRFLVLRDNKLLKNINISQLSERQKLGQLLSINEGELVYNEDEKAEKLYFVVQGKIKIIGSGEQGSVIEVNEGNYFGLDDRNSGGIRHSSAVALTDTYLISITYNEYDFLHGLPKLETEEPVTDTSEIEVIGAETVDESLLESFDSENPEGSGDDYSFDDSLPYNFDEMKVVEAEDDEPAAPPHEATIPQNVDEVPEEEAEFDDVIEQLPDSYSTPEENFRYSETEAEIVSINDKKVEEEKEEDQPFTVAALERFAEAVNILHSEFMVKDTYNKLLEAACLLTESDQGILYTQGRGTELVSVTGDEKIIIKSGMGVTGWAVQKAEPHVVNDVKTSGRFNAEFDEPPEYQTKSMLVLPVADDEGEVRFVYQLFNNADGNFTREHIAGLKILYKVAESAISKAKLYESDLKKQRVSALKKISGFLDKDIKKPVLVSKRYIEHLRSGYLPDNVDKVLNMMSGQLDGVVDLLRTISDYSAENLKLRLNPLYLNKLLKDFVTNLDPVFEERKINFRFDLDSECKIKVDNSRFAIVLDNLLNNAAEAMPEGGTITISTFVESDFVKISIRDNGTGIPSEIMDYIFEPFISSDNSNPGLGLFISRVIIEEHRATIAINSTGQKGTEVVIRFPLDKNF